LMTCASSSIVFGFASPAPDSQQETWGVPHVQRRPYDVLVTREYSARGPQGPVQALEPRGSGEMVGAPVSFRCSACGLRSDETGACWHRSLPREASERR